MFETTMEMLKAMGETPEGYWALLNMSALALPLPVVLAFVTLASFLLLTSRLPNPYFSVLMGFSWGPLIVVVVTEIWRIAPTSEPAIFHEPWWLTAILPAVLGPKIYDWRRQGSPLVFALFIAGIAAIFGSLAMVASRYAL